MQFPDSHFACGSHDSALVSLLSSTSSILIPCRETRALNLAILIAASEGRCFARFLCLIFVLSPEFPSHVGGSENRMKQIVLCHPRSHDQGSVECYLVSLNASSDAFQGQKLVSAHCCHYA
jgi:hypothetical protein